MSAAVANPRLLIWLSSITLALVVTMVILTMGRSVYSAWRTRRLDRVRASVRADLFENLDRDREALSEWVERLTRSERTALRELLGTLLENLRGDDRDKLGVVARELGIPSRAERDLESGVRHRQLRALHWYALLGEPVDRDLLLERCTGDPDTEAAAARVLLESDASDAVNSATEVLLADGNGLSVPGMDTLYRLHKHDPTELIRYSESASATWSNALMVQVLSVIGASDPVPTEVSLDWVIGCTTHESAEVRAAAFRALEEHGWREDVRTDVDWNRALNDPVPAVRSTVYRLLGGWDERVRELLIAVLADEPDIRSKLAGVEHLCETGRLEDLPTLTGLEDVRDWVVENRKVTRVA